MTKLIAQDLTLPRDARAVLEWPEPDIESIDALPSTEFEEDVRVLLRTQYELVLGQINFRKAEQTNAGLWLPAPAVAATDTEKLEDALFLKVARHLATYCDRMLRRDQRVADRVFKHQYDLEQFVQDMERTSRTHRQKERAEVTLAYLAIVPVAATMGRTTWTQFDVVTSTTVHKLLVILFKQAKQAKQPSIRELADLLTGQVLNHLAWVYEVVSRSYSEAPVRGQFTRLRVHELPLIAKRAETMAHKYGASRLSQRYEEQLSLVAQSFGFQVVRSKTGKSTVDLVCVNSDPRMSFTFLLEAKTCSQPYVLPKRDQRALEDYVDSVTGTLTMLPPVRFVMIVGPSGSRTLPAKIRNLSGAVRLPVRFVTASSLARLRSEIVGPLPMRKFLATVLEDEPMLGEGFIDRVVSAANRAQGAHEEFVEKLLE